MNRSSCGCLLWAVILLLMVGGSWGFGEWKNILPGLETYTDEDGEERLGFIQLGSSSSANYTINLTGLIMLGLGIAAATAMFAYFNAFESQRQLRSLPDYETSLPIILSELDRKFDEAGIMDDVCREKIVCDVHREGNIQEVGTFGWALLSFFTELHHDVSSPDDIKHDKTRLYYDASQVGRSGGDCRATYKCALAPDRVQEVQRINK